MSHLNPRYPIVPQRWLLVDSLSDGSPKLLPDKLDVANRHAMAA